MSSTKEHEFFSLENVHSSKQLGVTRERESLADYIRRVRQEKGLSLNQVRVHSGYKIANSYISRIENGEVTNVGLEKLRLLAKGLGVVEDEIFAVARGISLSTREVFDSEIYLMLKGYDELSDMDKAELLPTVRMLAAEIRRRKPKSPRPPKKAPEPERLPIIDTRVTPVGGYPAAEVVSLSKRGGKK